MKTPNPSSFGVWGVIGKKVEAKNPNGVTAKCAIPKQTKNESQWRLVVYFNATSHFFGAIFLDSSTPLTGFAGAQAGLVAKGPSHVSQARVT
jgi:hypothetical protein